MQKGAQMDSLSFFARSYVDDRNRVAGPFRGSVVAHESQTSIRGNSEFVRSFASGHAGQYLEGWRINDRKGFLGFTKNKEIASIRPNRGYELGRNQAENCHRHREPDV